MSDLQTSDGLERVALEFYFSLTSKWCCTQEQQYSLLGGLTQAEVLAWRDGAQTRLPRETLELISHLMAIHRSLRIIFSTRQDHMLQGGIGGVVEVRRYLETFTC
jgi:hypothetical protein